MVRTSNSSSSNSKQQTASKNKSKVTSKVTKYASKFVCQIMDNIIDKKINSLTSNPKSTRKWAEKMKISVLKKVSTATIDAFSDNNKSKELAKNVEDIKCKINEKKEQIELLLQKISKVHDDCLKQRFAHDSNPIIRQIEPIPIQIKDLIASIGTQVHNLTKRIPSESASLTETIHSIEAQLSTSLSTSSIHVENNLIHTPNLIQPQMEMQNIGSGSYSFNGNNRALDILDKHLNIE